MSTLDIILNEKNMHKVFDSHYVQEKIGNVFLKYSQKMDYCFSCSQVLFTNVFPPNNTNFLCLYSYTNEKHSPKSSKWPYTCDCGLFFSGRWWGHLKGRLFCFCLCACANACTCACMSF